MRGVNYISYANLVIFHALTRDWTQNKCFEVIPRQYNIARGILQFYTNIFFLKILALTFVTALSQVAILMGGSRGGVGQGDTGSSSTPFFWEFPCLIVQEFSVNINVIYKAGNNAHSSHFWFSVSPPPPQYMYLQWRRPHYLYQLQHHIQDPVTPRD